MLSDPQPLWKSIYQDGCAAYKNNDHRKAESLFTKAIASNPTHVGLYDCRAAAREKLGDLNGASQDAKKMLQIEPRSAKSYMRAGKILRMSEKFHSLVQLYTLGLTKIPETDPNRPMMLKLLAQAERAIEKRTKTESPTATKAPVCRDMVAFLPAELVHAIFRRLDFATKWRCSGVCKSWRRFLESSPYLWSEAIFLSAGTRTGTTNLTLQVLIDRARRHLKELDFGYAPRLTDAGIRSLQRSACMRIERLELMQNRKVSGSALSCWAKVAGTHLGKICLSGSAAADDTCIGTILNFCRKLKSLDVSACPITDDVFVTPMKSRDEILQRLKTSDDKSQKSTDQHLTLSLEEVYMDYCTRISSKVIKDLSTLCPNLSVLSLRNATQVDIRNCLQYLHLAQPRPQLQDLTLTGTSNLQRLDFDQVFTTFASNCPSLQKFELASCPMLTDLVMFPLAQTSGPRLTTINLTSSARITDGTLIALGMYCPNLLQVTLAGCPGLTDPGFQSMFQNCVLIQKLDLAGCPGFLDATCTPMAEWSEKLEELNVSRTMVSGVGIGKLVRGAGKGLRVLLMENCPNVGFDVATWAVKNLPPGAKVRVRMHHTK